MERLIKTVSQKFFAVWRFYCDTLFDLPAFALWLFFSSGEKTFSDWKREDKHDMRIKDFFSMDMLTVYVLVAALIVYCL